MYGDAFLEELDPSTTAAQDVNLLATLTEFTAQAVAAALEDHLPESLQPGEIVVAGGGEVQLRPAAPSVGCGGRRVSSPARTRSAFRCRHARPCPLPSWHIEPSLASPRRGLA